MHFLKSCFISLFFLLVIMAVNAHAVGVVVGPDDEKKSTKLNLPFAFYNETFGAAAGYVYGISGWPQPQSTALSTTIAGSTGSVMTFFIGKDMQIPLWQRWFVDTVWSIGYFNDNNSFSDGNPDYEDDKRAGANDSDEDNYVEGDGFDNFLRIKFKYLLPIGTGKDTIINTYKVAGGHLIEGAAGGYSMNPFVSGNTFLEFRPFYRSQEIDGEDVDNKTKTNGLDTSLYWDNRDWQINPKRGNSWRVEYSKDWGKFNSSGDWTSMEGEVDQYFELGKSTLTSWFSGRILALDAWTSYSPSWDNKSDGSVDNRPPTYTGATLGGLWRMRGYPSNRFSDRAAIYYCAEFRLTLRQNPFERWEWLQKYLGVQWVQIVPFVEVGRVAPEWDMDKLHSDMKYDGGLGIRLMAKGLTVRADFAASEEGFHTQMIIAQPFQF
ncbi:MAG: BamA/TamA family outer membrane protein [Deltaproteobacteria bacterium]|nr:BamA/TamA family outer membrane protein [Deltaproteobacteria bacterium]